MRNEQLMAATTVFELPRMGQYVHIRARMSVCEAM